MANPSDVAGRGGLMHVGLYSEAARRDVREARKFIADRGFG